MTASKIYMGGSRVGKKFCSIVDTLQKVKHPPFLFVRMKPGGGLYLQRRIETAFKVQETVWCFIKCSNDYILVEYGTGSPVAMDSNVNAIMKDLLSNVNEYMVMVKGSVINRFKEGVNG